LYRARHRVDEKSEHETERASERAYVHRSARTWCSLMSQRLRWRSRSSRMPCLLRLYKAASIDSSFGRSVRRWVCERCTHCASIDWERVSACVRVDTSLPRVPPMRLPRIRTGIVLPHLPSVCVGNDTYLSASYWQKVAPVFDTEMLK